MVLTSSVLSDSDSGLSTAVSLDSVVQDRRLRSFEARHVPSLAKDGLKVAFALLVVAPCFRFWIHGRNIWSDDAI